MAKDSAPGANDTELTVSELSGALKRTIEDRFGHVRLRGEVSGYRGPHSSGHAYFALKDENARLEAVIYRGAFSRLRIRPEEGLEVVVTGKITAYEKTSKYQIVIETLEPAGVGALMALLEERKRKLSNEGLFDPARKQLLPFLPQVIGVVTSPTGAVIRDILHRLADRFPRHVLVWPVRVQGETSAAEVARAIEGFNALEIGGDIPRPDVIIVARGGGSLEDLWGFNEEIVVRAAAASDIPLIAAVGHETDWTLIDLAADVRAPTPTAAAEMAVPVQADLLAQVAGLAARHRASVRRSLDRHAQDVRGLARVLRGAEDALAVPRQRLDRAGERLQDRLKARLRDHHVRLGKLSQLLARHSPQAELARRQGALDAARRDFLRLGPQIVKRRAEALNGTAKLLNSLGYHNVLARGFALVRDAQGQPVRSAAAIGAGARFEVELADGRIGAIADGEGASQPKKAEKSPRKVTSRGQGDLF